MIYRSRRNKARKNKRKICLQCISIEQPAASKIGSTIFSHTCFAFPLPPKGFTNTLNLRLGSQGNFPPYALLSNSLHHSSTFPPLLTITPSSPGVSNISPTRFQSLNSDSGDPVDLGTIALKVMVVERVSIVEGRQVHDKIWRYGMNVTGVLPAVEEEK